MARQLSPRKLGAMRGELREFHNLYVEYIDLTWPPNGRPPARATELRAELLGRVSKAQAALSQSGMGTIAMTPPPMIGGPVLTGLPNLLFVHETPLVGVSLGLGLNQPPFCQKVIEALKMADGYLAQQQEEAARRRRNPFYWLDRIVTTLLRVPAYILSRIIGVPVARIEESPFGLALRLLALAIDGLVAYIGGHELKWW